MKQVLRNVCGTYWVCECSEKQLPGYIFSIIQGIWIKPVVQVPYFGSNLKKAQEAALKAGLIAA